MIMGTAYVWSPSSSGFYPESEKERLKEIGAWPSDGVEVTEEEYEALFQVPPGKYIDTVDGRPGWVSAPTPPNSELLAKAISELSAVYKSDINELNTAYLAAIVNDGPAEATKQLAVRNQITARKAKYATDIQEAKSRYPV